MDSNSIAKKDADQLGGSVRWNERKNPGVANLPVMLHPTDVLDLNRIPFQGRVYEGSPGLVKANGAQDSERQ